MPVSEQTFLQLALEDPNGRWELHCGRLRQKPEMTAEHNHQIRLLSLLLVQQLDRRAYEVSINLGHVRTSGDRYYIPNLYVIPVDQLTPQRGQRDQLETYEAPLPLVVEFWSPSTGDYDVDTKLPEYQRRGDLEIWRIHPFEHTLLALQRQPDGSYTETRYSGGIVRPVALPSVAIDLDELFA